MSNPKTSCRAIPEGYHSLTPYFIVHNAREAIDFYKKALGATEIMCMGPPGGKVHHAELRIGDSHFMLADEFPEMGAKSAKTIGGSPVSFMLYVEDVDFVAKQAVAAGMKEKYPVKNQFYGDRNGTFTDPYGISWTISTHVEDVSPEEMEKRAKAAMPGKHAE
jgi:PhnB protein